MFLARFGRPIRLKCLWFAQENIAGWKGTFELLDIATGEINVLEDIDAERHWTLDWEKFSYSEGKYLLQWNSMNTYIAEIVDGNGILKIRDAANFQVVYTIDKEYEALSFSPDGNTLTISDSKAVELLDIASGKTRPAHVDANFRNTYGAEQLEWSTDGRFLAAISGANIRIFNVQTGKLMDRYTMPGSYLGYVGWFGRSIMAIDQYNCISSWQPNLNPSSFNFEQGQRAPELDCTVGDVVDYHPSHGFYAVNNNNMYFEASLENVSLFADRRIIGQLKHEARVYWLDWSPNGVYLGSITYPLNEDNGYPALHIWQKSPE